MSSQKARPDAQQKSGIFRSIVGRYRALKRALADALGRGDSEYSRLTALSQEIARLRAKIRTELDARRQRRIARQSANSAQGIRAGNTSRPPAM